MSARGFRSRLERSETGLRETLATNRSHLSNAASMLGTTTVTSLLGAGFWWLAARGFSQDDVGLATASVSAMTLLGFLATFGLGTLLMGELPQRKEGRRSLINAALASVFAIGALFGLLFTILAPLVSDAFEPVAANAVTIGVFILGVGLTGLVFVLDEALIGLLRGGLQLSRNTMFASVKFVALIPVMALVSDAGPGWIYGAWVVGIAISFVVMVRFFRERIEADPLRPNFVLLRKMRGSALSHFAFNLALEAANLSLPILIVGLISPRANASFYVAWMIAGHLVVVPGSLGTVLYPIGSDDRGSMSRGLLLTVKVSVVIGIVANLLLLPLAEPVLGIFGAGYAQMGTTPLHIMALAVFPLTVKALYVAVHRVERTLRVGLPFVWGGAILELGAATIGALVDGLTGVAVAWLGAAIVQAVVMAPSVLRAYREPVPGDDHDSLSADELDALDGLAVPTKQIPG
ncbi:MAG TPA: lipopolysaccharide biosynthesis protein [Solirubrobacterales bacterium]|jgi:O-antigen/teichoic acid export membrane protein|nr:lipopolysaccharide biosynthesis protein [Solirubrobacterales bacterium]